MQLVKVTKKMNASFFRGALFTTAVLMAAQDWYGKEGYIKLCQESWTEISWLVGASIALIAIVWEFYSRKEAKNQVVTETRTVLGPTHGPTH